MRFDLSDRKDSLRPRPSSASSRQATPRSTANCSSLPTPPPAGSPVREQRGGMHSPSSVGAISAHYAWRYNARPARGRSRGTKGAARSWRLSRSKARHALDQLGRHRHCGLRHSQCHGAAGDGAAVRARHPPGRRGWISKYPPHGACGDRDERSGRGGAGRRSGLGGKLGVGPGADYPPSPIRHRLSSSQPQAPSCPGGDRFDHREHGPRSIVPAARGARLDPVATLRNQ